MRRTLRVPSGSLGARSTKWSSSRSNNSHCTSSPELRPSLPPTRASKDYSDWRLQLERMDLMLVELEGGLIQDALTHWHKTHPEPSPRAQANFERHALRAIRCELLRTLTQLDYRHLKVKITHVVTDRGFDSQENQQLLEREAVFNGMCPRNPHRMKQRLGEEEFVALQKRRSQTEGRIGIFKNVFLGRPLRAKGFEHRKRAVAWAVLAHNLWVLARMEWKEEAKKAA